MINGFCFLATCSINGIFTRSTEAILKAEQEADAPKLAERDQMIINHQNLKASAKAKLIAGEPLTEEEADTIIL